MSKDTRTRVLHAAGPIFAEKGCEGATVREICAAAEANLASINYHFRDKETLYTETVKMAHLLRLEQVPGPDFPQEMSPEDKLHRFVVVMLSRMLGTGELAWQTKLMMREMLQPTNACKPLVEEFIRPQLNLLLGILDELIPVEVPAHRRLQVAFSIVGQCLHYKFAREFVAILVPEEERRKNYSIEKLATHITEFTVAALKSWAMDPDQNKPAKPIP